MYVVISPAKRLNEKAPPVIEPTMPTFIDDASRLAQIAKKLKHDDLKKLMGISDKLAELNSQRFQSFTTPYPEDKAKPAALYFAGDTYMGLDASSWSDDDFDHAQSHLGILSGLYGLLRPKDLILPYRLEMGSKLANKQGSDLYSYWGSKIANEINERTKNLNHPPIINLASNEYFKSIDTKALKSSVIVPVFKENRNGKLKIISFNAKKARGMMAKYIICNRLSDPESLKSFDVDGYRFDGALSNNESWLFVR